MTAVFLRWTMLASLAALSGGTGMLKQPRPPVPVIVELFTSEGCSSCPPADQLLIDLTTAPPLAGAQVIGLSEHVDYWDQLGWKDPFSSRVFTERQESYATGSNDVYTPQVIVDGIHRMVGSDRVAVMNAIRRAAGEEKAPIRLSWSPDASVLDVTLDPHPRSAAADVWVAIVEDGLSSSVKRGENAGRLLRHASVARRLVRVGKTDRNGGFRQAVSIAVHPSWNRSASRVIVFVQAQRLGRVTAADIIGLPPR